jgi:hypothetical protein
MKLAASILVIALLCTSSIGLAQTANKTGKSAPVAEPKECIVLPGRSGVIQDRCKQIHLQCGPHWYKKLCGQMIRPVF